MNLESLTDPQLHEIVVEMLQKLEVARPRLAFEMRELLSRSISDFEDDPQLNDLLLASIEGNLSTVTHVMMNDIDLDAIIPPTAAIEYAIRLAQRDVPLAALTRAYYLAQGLMLSTVLEEVDKLRLPEGTKIATIRSVATKINGYIDHMLQSIAEAHENEHKRWWSAQATANTPAILKVLRGELISPASFTAQTRYDLEHTHLAMVLWLEESSGVGAQQKLDR